MSQRRGVTAAVIVTSLVAISAGAWGLSKWSPFANDGDIDWPENVQPVVDFIEDLAGLEFRREITLEYIPFTPEYNTRASDPPYRYTDDERDALAIDEAAGRALGLWDGDASLIESFETINSAAPRPVRWFPDENVLVINGRDNQPVLPVDVRVDLVVYLTQALTDQHFGIIDRLNSATTGQEYDGLAAAQLGFALWVNDEYIDDLSSADRDEYEFNSLARSEEYVETIASVPSSYLAARIAFQVLGHVFATVLAEDDPDLALDALGDGAPVALDQVSLPAAKYLREDELESVEAPTGPFGATIHYSEQLGPFRLFLMFATGLPTAEAMTATDGWGNDRFTVYELAGRVCADLHIVADSRADADRLERALNGWAFARPDGASALVGREGVNLYASVCDPGPDANQSVASENEINHYFGRADFLRQRSVDTGKPELAECVATTLFAQFTTDEIYSGEVEAELEDIEDDCQGNLLTV